VKPPPDAPKPDNRCPNFDQTDTHNKRAETSDKSTGLASRSPGEFVVVLAGRHPQTQRKHATELFGGDINALY
jgi:hypothetical protein